MSPTSALPLPPATFPFPLPYSLSLPMPLASALFPLPSLCLALPYLCLTSLPLPAPYAGRQAECMGRDAMRTLAASRIPGAIGHATRALSASGVCGARRDARAGCGGNWLHERMLCASQSGGALPWHRSERPTQPAAAPSTGSPQSPPGGCWLLAAAVRAAAGWLLAGGSSC